MQRDIDSIGQDNLSLIPPICLYARTAQGGCEELVPLEFSD